VAEGVAGSAPRAATFGHGQFTEGANACVVVTSNEKDFAGVQILNPLNC
jgi:hypothetical protein